MPMKFQLDVSSALRQCWHNHTDSVLRYCSRVMHICTMLLISDFYKKTNTRKETCKECCSNNGAEEGGCNLSTLPPRTLELCSV